MYTRFDISKFYEMSSQNKQRILPYKTLRVDFITEVESVYSVVQSEFLYNTGTFHL
jgi:hypothetical protein